MLRIVLEGAVGKQRLSGLRFAVTESNRVVTGQCFKPSASTLNWSPKPVPNITPFPHWSWKSLKWLEDSSEAGRRSFLSTARVNKASFSYQKVSRCFYTSSTKESEQGRLIYTGNIAKAVLGVKFFSYSSSMFSLCVMPYVLFRSGVGVQNLALQVAFYSIVGVFTFLTPLLLHLITKGYVVRLYHNAETDTYTAVTYSALLVEKKTVFHQKDIKVPDISKMFTTFYANKKSMLVNPMLFPVPNDYNHLMGYDQPFSFDLEDLSDQDKNKQS
ncbi:transmembrane protein 70, mitochondrial [Polyodon spathula]|nr:transmembrane protein 70, mitochondrial [Polyodon spathula]